MGSSSDKKLASAVGAKSARACDNCIKKRARWYCAADDAFLCQNCDSSVHSANPLAKRHERVRLKSFKSFDDDELTNFPSWHQGFTRKPRTSPRQRKKLSSFITRIVPEICNEEGSNNNGNGNGNGNLSSKDDNELLYQVPIFDPFGAANSNNVQKDDDFMSEMNFLPSEMDLAEFAANVESLLGKGLEGESFDIESLGLLDCGDHHRDQMDEDHTKGCFLGGESVKFENDGEDFEFNFDYDDSPVTGEEAQIGDQEHILMMMNNSSGSCDQENDDSKKKILLKLDYDRVLSAWDDQKSPWMNGERPDLDSSDCWPDCVGSSGTMHIYGGMGVTSGHGTTVMDGAREARVSRYREKRQKRLFSKKIRYEVRKLNAQKRPRMKGRFVKRSNLVASALTTLIKT